MKLKLTIFLLALLAFILAGCQDTVITNVYVGGDVNVKAEIGD